MRRVLAEEGKVGIEAVGDWASGRGTPRRQWEQRQSVRMSVTSKDFHMTIAAAGRSPYLRRQNGDLLDAGRHLLHLHYDHVAQGSRGHFHSTAHDDLIEPIEPIEARDVEIANRLVHEHTRHLQDRFLRSLEADYAAAFRLDNSQDLAEDQVP